MEVVDDAALERAQAAAALIADALQGHLTEDLLLVLDDLHVVETSVVAWRGSWRPWPARPSCTS